MKLRANEAKELRAQLKKAMKGRPLYFGLFAPSKSKVKFRISKKKSDVNQQSLKNYPLYEDPGDNGLNGTACKGVCTGRARVLTLHVKNGNNPDGAAKNLAFFIRNQLKYQRVEEVIVVQDVKTPDVPDSSPLDIPPNAATLRQRLDALRSRTLSLADQRTKVVCNTLLLRAQQLLDRGANASLDDIDDHLDDAEDLLDTAGANAGTATRKSYEAAKDAAMPTIENAMTYRMVGGNLVASYLIEAGDCAKAEQWDQASRMLELAESLAEQVIARAPYALERRTHEASIKAAFGIKAEGLGTAIKEKWKKIEELAAQKYYKEAAEAIVHLAKVVKAAQNDPQLVSERDAIHNSRRENVELMQKQIAGGTPDLKTLRELVNTELSLAKQAAAAGDDPGARSREPLIDSKAAEDRFKSSDWFTLKDNLHAGVISSDEMWDCWRYRQQYVTRLIDILRKKYPTLIAKAVGSTDLESDIDITFASVVPGDDVKAAQEFNRCVLEEFGKPPGIVFDVNIYPRDYNAAKESINPDYHVDPLPDRGIDEPGSEAMQHLSQVDQDVATLLKQRRFLDQASFDALMQSVIDKTSDEETKKQIRKQFEEGEDIFLLTAQEKIGRIIQKLEDAKLQLQEKLQEKLQEYESLHETNAYARVQQLIPEVLEALESSHPAPVMQVTDEMYLEKMGQLREDQARLAKLSHPQAPPALHHDGACDEVHPTSSHDQWRTSEYDRLAAKVKKDQFTNIIFANEAYMSQGALTHVVTGMQGGQSDAVTKLSPATLLQSCNEQIADFFKDMKGAEHKIRDAVGDVAKRRETGKAFVHASKYLVRMLDAAGALVDKLGASSSAGQIDFTLLKTSGIGTTTELKKQVEQVLLAMRKSSMMPADVKGEVGVDEVQRLFQVSSLAEFNDLIRQFCVEINQAVRSTAEFQQELSVDPAAERQYFGVPEHLNNLSTLLKAVPQIFDAPIPGGPILEAIKEAKKDLGTGQRLVAAGRVDTPGPGGPATAEEIEQAVLQARRHLDRLKKLDVKSVLRIANGLHALIERRIRELQQYRRSESHADRKEDIDRACTQLEARSTALRQDTEKLQNDLKDSIKELKSTIEELTALSAKPVAD